MNAQSLIASFPHEALNVKEGLSTNVLVGGGLIGVDEDGGMELQQQSGAVPADVATAAQVEVESHGGGFLRQQMQHHQG